MSTCDVLPNCENSKSFKNCKKKSVEHNELNKVNSSKEDLVLMHYEHEKNGGCQDIEEKPAYKSLVNEYDKETLLELRSAPASLCKPECLDEQFFNKDGVWDPEAWHKSNSSRSASPAVDGKTVLVEGKKMDLIIDDIELAPRRRSFKQGCHVQTEKDHKTTDWLGKPVFEKKNRLTGRAAVHRRSENTLSDPNEALSERAHEFERMRREKFFDKDEKPARFNNRFSDGGFDRNRQEVHKRERQDSLQDGKSSKQHAKNTNKGTNFRKNYDQRKNENTEEQLPEWMTDGPTSQLDIMEFTGFQDIEEEKKAYMKKRKVRISPHGESPDVKDEKQARNSQASTTGDKDSKSFDINDFFNEVDYYPPHLFGQDTIEGDGIKSRFTQWFQAQHQRSHSNSVSSAGGSRPGSATLIPDEVITGVHQSPNVSVPYFTPIQPAPVLVSAAANAYAMQTSNISSIMQQQRKDEEEKKANVEVKGRLSLKEIEEENLSKSDKAVGSKSAFDMLVMSMKEAGQLPDKPAPVVSGLPEHLLPQPPKRSSPTFEKLKRSLSRSPSPGQLMNAVATVASLISTTPTLQNDLALNQSSDDAPKNKVVDKPNADVNESYLNESSTQHSKLLQTAFTPTSVLKKIHNEKQRESPVPALDLSYVEKHNSKQDSEGVDISKLKISENKAIDPVLMTPDRSQQRVSTLPFHSAPTTPRNTVDMATVSAPASSMSLPVTPDHASSKENRVNGSHASMLSPNPVLHLGSAFTPMKTQGEESSLMAPSAFHSLRTQKDSQDFGVIGSGIPQRFNPDELRLPGKNDHARGIADPRLAPGNGARNVGNYNLSRKNDPSLAPGNPIRPGMQSTPLQSHHIPPQSQQQQLLHAQRMAQIQRAQLQQQQKLQQIAQQANQQKALQSLHQGKPFSVSSGIGPLLPDPDSVNPQQLRTPAEQRLHQQQQQRQQIQAYQQQQQQQQATQNYQRTATAFSGNNFRGHSLQGGHPNTKLSPQIPMPLQQSALPLHHLQQRPPHNFQNFAAQALAQQHLLNRARFLAQAQLLQQQPQVVQAALMAQAALARGQAQAQAAMMLNPRNLQAMAEQMGIRPSHLNNNKAIPTPMVAPQAAMPSGTKMHDGVSAVSAAAASTENNVLSKWFTQDILQKLPQKTAPTDLPNGKVLSVEELEKAQRSS